MIEELLIYQAEDSKLREIEKQLSESEEKKKAISAKKVIDGAADNINRLDVKASSLVSEYENLINEEKKLKEFYAEFEKAIEHMESENEAAYLLKKIEEVSAKIKAYGEKINAVNTEIQAVLKEYVGVRNSLKSAQAQYSQFGQKYVELKESKKSERETIENQLEKLKQAVDKDLMAKYLAKRKNFYPVVYEVSGDSCGACLIELPLGERNKLKNGEVIECSNCGRLLFQKKQ